MNTHTVNQEERMSISLELELVGKTKSGNTSAHSNCTSNRGEIL